MPRRARPGMPYFLNRSLRGKRLVMAATMLARQWASATDAEAYTALFEYLDEGKGAHLSTAEKESFRNEFRAERKSASEARTQIDAARRRLFIIGKRHPAATGHANKSRASLPAQHLAEPRDSLDDVIGKFRDADPQFREQWDRDKAKVEIAAFLVRMRQSVGLSRAEIGKALKMDRSAISRIENANGGMPDIDTINRYAGACGFQVHFVAASRQSDREDVIASLPKSARAVGGMAEIGKDAERSKHTS